MFQWYFKKVIGVFEQYFKNFRFKGCIECFKGMSIVFQGCLKNADGCYIGVSSPLIRNVC